MQVYRSEFWLKDKHWFSDFPRDLAESCDNVFNSRLAWDIQSYYELSNKKIGPFTTHRLVRRLHRYLMNDIKFSWSMKDWGLVEI